MANLDGLMREDRNLKQLGWTLLISLQYEKQFGLYGQNHVKR